ncbi:polysaccharide deacetylase [Pseudofrankia sp. EUN1h]|nr:polysaccharide deacetylase [Pseudofrankia sp. EUN1h]
MPARTAQADGAAARREGAGTRNPVARYSVGSTMTRGRRVTALCAFAACLAVLPACGGDGKGQPAGTTSSPTGGLATATATASPGGTGQATASPTGPTPSGPASQQPSRPATPQPGTTKPGTAGPPPTTTQGTALPARLLGKDWERIPTDRKIVALTFDAGANADGVAPILATLAREHVPGTFFLTGQFANSYSSKVRDIAASGGRIGNHSSTHPYFTKLDDAALRSEVLGAQHDIQAASGRDPRPLFRFPFGDRNAHDIAAVNALGYVPVRWTVDTLGWQGTSGGRSAASVTARVVDALQPGEIVLMHLGSHPQDHSTLDADALPGIISALRDRGYGFVTLDTLLG